VPDDDVLLVVPVVEPEVVDVVVAAAAELDEVETEADVVVDTEDEAELEVDAGAVPSAKMFSWGPSWKPYEG